MRMACLICALELGRNNEVTLVSHDPIGLHSIAYLEALSSCLKETWHHRRMTALILQPIGLADVSKDRLRILKPFRNSFFRN